MESSEAVRALGALANASRLQVFRELVVAGGDGLTPTTLATRLAVAPSSLSFHLKELMHAGLVSQERTGRSLIYRARYDHMRAVVGYLTDNCCQGQPCEVSDGLDCASVAKACP